MFDQQTRRSRPLPRIKALLGCVSACFAVVIVFAVTCGQPANAYAKMIPQPKPVQISQCTGCHTPKLTGQKGFSPNIHVHGGAMHDYSKAQFETLMATGVMNNGKHIKNMPTFKYSKPIADKLFAYLRSTT